MSQGSQEGKKPRSGNLYRERRLRGYAYGLALGSTVVLLTLLRPQFRAKGDFVPGHENLECEDCHSQAPGTMRQQIQANAKWLFGWRSEPAPFGHLEVDNEACLACHERPDDRHPVYRFMEPRFKDARDAIAPQNCESCHREHLGQRVTREANYCSTCHEDIDLAEDPIAPTHKELAAQKAWDTCLSCHDFHGNHDYESPTDAAKGITRAALLDYLATGDSPYGAVVHEAKTERDRESR